MDLTWSPEEEAFRAEVRSWLEANVPKTDVALGDDEFDDSTSSFEFRRSWQRKLGEAGYLAMHWPKEYGGGGRTLVEQVIFNEEYARANAPQPVNSLGLNLVGPTLMTHGTEEQRRRFLKNILTADEIWCQGYSEPNAGSDLAGLQTRAELVGDEFVINGQKIWTTLAPFGDWIFVLCRTDPQAPKHQGISYILCPMDQPGVEVRPIKMIGGESEFNEVFFTDARTAKENVVGEVNGGWAVAMTLLGYERGEAAATLPIRFRTELDRLLALAKQYGKEKDPVIRQRLAWAYSKVEIMRFLGMRALTAWLAGGHPGPDASISKLNWSEYHRLSTELAMDIMGLHGLVPTGRQPSSAFQTDDPGAPNDTASWTGTFLNARAGTIYAGTSQIQRNIIGELVLGLPKEPRADGGAWNETRK